MRHASFGDQLHAQRALRGQRQPVLRRFAVDEKLRTARLLVGYSCALAVAFLTHQEQQADVNPFGFQLLRCRNLRDDDALRVARTAAVDAVFGLLRRNVGRHRIHVRRERQRRLRMAGMRGPDVHAIAFDRHALDVVAKGTQLAVERHTDGRFHSGGGFNVDQFAGESEDVHIESISIAGWHAGECSRIPAELHSQVAVVITVLLARQMLTPLERVDDAVLVIEDGIISAAGTRAEMSIPAGARIIDFSDAILTPGLVDIHIHGAAGHDVMEGDADSLAAIERLLARHGVTSYCPTTVTAPLNETLAALEKLARAVESAKTITHADRAQPLGIHLEGPFLSHARPGVHPP